MKTLFVLSMRFLMAALLLAVFATVAGTYYLKEGDYRSIVEEWVESGIGRQFEIAGNLGIYPGKGLTLYAEQIRVANAAWSDHPTLLAAERVEVRLSMSELFRGRVVAEHLMLKGIDLLIEQRQDRRFNVSQGGEANSEDYQPLVAPDWLDVRSVSLNGIRISVDLIWRDWDIWIEEGRLVATEPDAPLRVGLHGTLNRVPVEVAGTLGTINTWMKRQPSDGVLTMTAAGEHTIRAVGSVGDVLGWRGVDARIEGGIDWLRDISSWFRYTPLALDHVLVAGRIVQPGRFSTISLEEFSGSAGYYGIHFTADGRIGNLARFKGLEIGVKTVDEWELDRIPLGDFTRLNPKVIANAMLTGATYDLNMEISRLEVVAAGMTIDGKGVITNASRLWEQTLPLEIEVTDLEALGKEIGRNWPKATGLLGKAELIRNKSGFELRNILLETTGDLLALKAAGSIRSIGREQQQGELKIQGVAFRDFFYGNDVLTVLHPKLAEMNAVWQMTGTHQQIHLEKLGLEFPGGVLTGSGRIPDLKSPYRFSLDVRGLLREPRALADLHELTLPALPELRAEAVLHGEGNGVWILEQIRISGEQGINRLKMEGESRFSPGRTEFSLHTEGTLEADAMLPWYGDAMDVDGIRNNLGPVRASFDLHSGEGGMIAMGRPQFASDWAGAEFVVSGETLNLNPLEGDLTFSLSGKPAALVDMLPDQIPDLERLELGFDFQLPWKNHLDTVEWKGSTESGQFVFKGEAVSLKPFGFDQGLLRVKDWDPIELKQFSERLIPGNRISAEAILKSDSGTLSAEITGRMGGSLYEGSASWKPGSENGKTELDVDIAIDQLDVKSLLVRSEEKEESEPGFSQKPMLPEWLLGMNGAVRVQVEDYWGRTTHLKDLTFRADMHDGIADAAVEASLGQGTISGRIQYPANGSNLVELHVIELPVEAIRALSKGNALLGGTIDAEVVLRGEETTLAGLLGHGQGQIKIDIRESRIDGLTLDRVGGDLLTNLFAAINILDRKRNYSAVNCGVLYLEVNEGKAVTKHGLAIKTDRVTVVGDGEITFPDNGINFMLAPKARQGLGINVTSIARVVRVGGTLRDPKIETDPQGILTTGVNIVSALASGGISLFALGLYDRLHANSDVCEIARGIPQTSESDLGQLSSEESLSQ